MITKIVIEEKSIGNIKKEYGEIARQAAEQTGYNILIKDDATDVEGRPLPYLWHLVTLTPTKDHGFFWAKYRELGGK